MGRAQHEGPAPTSRRATAQPTQEVARRVRERDDRVPRLDHRRVSIVGERRFAGVIVRALACDDMSVLHVGRPEGSPSRVLWFVRRGAGSVSAGREESFGAGDTIVLPRDEPVTLTAAAPAEVWEIALGGKGRWWPPSLCVSRPTASSAAAVALAAAILKGMPRPTDAEVEQLRGVFEALVQSTAASAAPGAHGVDPIVRRADAVIAEQAHDPEFSVERLAQMLSVSRRHLTRVLSHAGRAPADRIRDVRLSRVRVAWDAHGDELLRDDLLARWFGFRSARALRESLSREGPPSPLTVPPRQHRSQQDDDDTGRGDDEESVSQPHGLG